MSSGDLDLVPVVARPGVGGVTWEEGEHMDYATIAKAGGRCGELGHCSMIPNYHQLVSGGVNEHSSFLDLLHHDPAQFNKDKLPVTAPAMVDWFAHPEPPPRPTSEYISPLKDHWCQWDTTSPKLPEIVPKSSKMSQTYPPVTNRDNVNFARLLTLDYQREWLQKRHEKQEKLKKLARVSV